MVRTEVPFSVLAGRCPSLQNVPKSQQFGSQDRGISESGSSPAAKGIAADLHSIDGHSRIFPCWVGRSLGPKVPESGPAPDQGAGGQGHLSPRRRCGEDHPDGGDDTTQGIPLVCSVKVQVDPQKRTTQPWITLRSGGGIRLGGLKLGRESGGGTRLDRPSDRPSLPSSEEMSGRMRGAEVHSPLAPAFSRRRSPAVHGKPPANIVRVLGPTADGPHIEQSRSVTAVAITANPVARQGHAVHFGRIGVGLKGHKGPNGRLRPVVPRGQIGNPGLEQEPRLRRLTSCLGEAPIGSAKRWWRRKSHSYFGEITLEDADGRMKRPTALINETV